MLHLCTDIDTSMLKNLVPDSTPSKLAMLWQDKQMANKRQETGGLHSVLKLAIGTRVMLTTNVDVSDRWPSQLSKR